MIFSGIISGLLAVIDKLGYVGIFVAMLIESTFFPLPAETIMIPAGALIAQGKMNFFYVFFSGLLGTLAGSVLSFYFALLAGRRTLDYLVSKYGKIIFVSKRELDRTEGYYKKHGEITTFIGRLIPGIRHLISLPAGFSKMNLGKFFIFTGAGAGLWSLVLIYSGWLADKNQAWLSQHPVIIATGIVVLAALIITSYTLFVRKRKNRN